MEATHGWLFCVHLLPLHMSVLVFVLGDAPHVLGMLLGSDHARESAGIGQLMRTIPVDLHSVPHQCHGGCLAQILVLHALMKRLQGKRGHTAGAVFHSTSVGEDRQKRLNRVCPLL